VSGGNITDLYDFRGIDGKTGATGDPADDQELTAGLDGVTLYGATVYGGSNNDGVVFATPEPGSAALMVTGLLAFAARRRRRTGE
jgi:hypothetical protein